MGKVVGGMTMSLDGFVNGRNGDMSRLYPDLVELRKTEMLQESMKATGAVVMGRGAYDLGEGDFTDYEYQVPIFVLTHHVPEKAAKGQNDRLTITFVANGIESAINQAKAAAGDKDVTVVGGANTIQQLLNAGLLDELQVGVVPVLLGEGLRFFEDLRTEQIELERIKVQLSPYRTDLTFRVAK